MPKKFIDVCVHVWSNCRTDLLIVQERYAKREEEEEGKGGWKKATALGPMRAFLSRRWEFSSEAARARAQPQSSCGAGRKSRAPGACSAMSLAGLWVAAVGKYPAPSAPTSLWYKLPLMSGGLWLIPLPILFYLWKRESVGFQNCAEKGAGEENTGIKHP